MRLLENFHLLVDTEMANPIDDIFALALASEIIEKVKLTDNELLSPEAKQRIIDHGLKRIRLMLEKKQLRRLQQDVRSQTRDLPMSTRLATQERIFAKVLEATGIDLSVFLNDDAKKVEAILGRGEIRTPGEFRLIRAYLDQVEGVAEYTDFAAAIQKLLDVYELARMPSKD